MLQLPIAQPQNYQFSSSPWSSFSLTVPSGLLWIVFLVIVVVFIIFSYIFVYHWRKYAFDFFALAKVEIIYFGVSVVLLFAMLTSLVAYVGYF